jgi:hypothetical protein
MENYVFYNPTDRKSTMVASDDIDAEVATLLTGRAWSGHISRMGYFGVETASGTLKRTRC